MLKYSEGKDVSIIVSLRVEKRGFWLSKHPLEETFLRQLNLNWFLRKFNATGHDTCIASASIISELL